MILEGFYLIAICVTDAAAFTKHFNESLFKVTENRLFSIEILMDDKEYRIGKNVIGVVIHDARDEDVEGAEIDLTLRDGLGQDIAVTPLVKDKGDGLYTVANVDPRRGGKFELRMKVKKKNNEDSAIFIFPDVLERKMPAGKYD